ncbi:MAG TPA: glycoside hydrolase family 5 protein [Polyangia bacterium]|jgi:aryl-phospho-beta-D-glucosidase BglC (GH1 family)|nr:glycoside hydrolase family 5 protein [Polyangia bacterium]
MKRTLQLAALVIVALCWLATAPAQQAGQPSTDKPAATQWWQGEDQWRRPQPNPDAKKMPRLKVEGNHFVDPDGKTALLRGLAIADPDKIKKQGHWNKNLFEHVKEMGATVVRIPVHPVAWRERTPEKYLELLDQAVAWCTKLNIYVIIDWHSIGNLETELFQAPMYNTSRQETYEFWRAIAGRFLGNNTVGFYELFNEPTSFRGTFGRARWSEWKRINETIIYMIRSFDNESIILVGGFDWAYDLTPLREDPIDAANIGYTVHPYSNKRPQPWEPRWDEDFGFAVDTWPVVATEFGFDTREGEKIDESHYARRIIKYLEGKGISWACWCYDPDWGPKLLKDWKYKLTPAGEFFKKAMHGNATP